MIRPPPFAGYTFATTEHVLAAKDGAPAAKDGAPAALVLVSHRLMDGKGATGSLPASAESVFTLADEPPVARVDVWQPII